MPMWFDTELPITHSRMYKGYCWRLIHNGNKIYVVITKSGNFEGLHPLPDRYRLGIDGSKDRLAFIRNKIDEIIEMRD